LLLSWLRNPQFTGARVLAEVSMGTAWLFM
jgi:hypothetical protein